MLCTFDEDGEEDAEEEQERENDDGRKKER